MRNLTTIVFALTACLALPAGAQDLAQIARTEPLKVSGHLGGGIRLYHADGISNRNNPFVWTTSGSLNVSLFGINTPFSFLFSSQDQEFRQPFNRFGINPSYKWAKLYAGYRTLEFSPYTASGNSILGAGIDLNPGRFRFSAAYGRLRTAVQEDTTSVIPVNPSYKRMAYAIRTGYGTTKNYVDLTVLKATDEVNSIVAPVKSKITPEDNLVWSVRTEQSIADRLRVRGEFAQSLLNRDIRAERLPSASRRWFNHIDPIFNATASLQSAKAFDAALIYRVSQSVTVDMDYQRVDPNYRTLGSYFFNNDREQMAINTTLTAFGNSLQVKGGVGTTRNNLASTQSQSMLRKAGNLNVAFAKKTFNVSATYSTFNSAINFIADPLNPLRNPEDTLNIVQVSRNAGLFTNYSRKGLNKLHNVSFSASYQGQAPGKGSESARITSSGMYNGNLVYRVSFTRTKSALTFNMHYNQSDFSSVRTQRVGPTIGGSQTFFKSRLKLVANGSVFYTYTGGASQNTTYNSRLSADWRVNSHHSFNAAVSLISRVNNSETSKAPSFREYVSTINYNFRF